MKSEPGRNFEHDSYFFYFKIVFLKAGFCFYGF